MINNTQTRRRAALSYFNNRRIDLDNSSSEAIEAYIEEFAKDTSVVDYVPETDSWEALRLDEEDRAYLRESMRKIVYRKVVLVGRHVSDLPPYVEVVEQINMMWETSLPQCVKQLKTLIDKADAQGAGILLQNAPGILMAAIAQYLNQAQGAGFHIPLGIIISVPGPRLAGASKTFQIDDESAIALRDAVLFANGRAKVDIQSGETTVTVDPVSEFKFDHIEWL